MEFHRQEEMDRFRVSSDAIAAQIRRCQSETAAHSAALSQSKIDPEQAPRGVQTAEGFSADEKRAVLEVAKLIEQLEAQPCAPGMFCEKCIPVLAMLGRLPTDRVWAIFVAAGQWLGSAGRIAAPERGMLAGIQLYIESGRCREAVSLGRQANEWLPKSFLIRHFTAVAAQMTTPRWPEEREALLCEAIRLEEQARGIPGASGWPEFGASLSVSAQCHHQLSESAKRRGDHTLSQVLQDNALLLYKASLRHGRPALRLALFGQALRDAGRLAQALRTALEATEKEWFLFEAQDLVLDLANRSTHVILPEFENHLRHWSRVVGEETGSPRRDSGLHAYLDFLTVRNIKPEFVARAAGKVEATRWKAECDAASPAGPAHTKFLFQ